MTTNHTIIRGGTIYDEAVYYKSPCTDQPIANRHMVTIETERTGTITLTPEQFDLLLECAALGTKEYYGGKASNADLAFICTVANNVLRLHSA